MKFKPSKQGFNDLRNEDFIQKQCLSVAQKAASIAGGKTGHSWQCDVQPGKTRCHARAKCYMHGALTQKEFYREDGYANECEAGVQAAEALGGEGRWKRSKSKNSKKRS